MSERTKKSLQVFGCLLVPFAFLIMVFYPIFTTIRENARTNSCHTHLKQLGVAFLQYSQDSDDFMPDAASQDGYHDWRKDLLPYVKLKERYHCPDRNDAVDSHGFSQNYAANDSLKGALASPGSTPIAHKDYPNPSKLILLLEAENNPRPDFNIDDSTAFGPQSRKLWAGHFRRHSSFLMADGHAVSLPPADTYLYDPKNHSLFNFWYRNTDIRLSPSGVAVLQETTKQFR